MENMNELTREELDGLEKHLGDWLIASGLSDGDYSTTVQRELKLIFTIRKLEADNSKLQQQLADATKLLATARDREKELEKDK